jgi:hypothetical protein
VEIYNLMGTPLFKKTFVSENEAISIGTEKLSAGCYLLEIKTTDKTIYSNRLVIIK